MYTQAKQLTTTLVRGCPPTPPPSAPSPPSCLLLECFLHNYSIMRFCRHTTDSWVYTRSKVTDLLLNTRRALMHGRPLASLAYECLFSVVQSLTFARVLLRAQTEVPSRERKRSGKIFDRRQALANRYCTKWRTYG